MKQVVLLGLNARYSHSNPALYSLRTVVADICDCTILEFSINAELNGIIQNILHNNAEVLALSVYIWNASLVREMIKQIALDAPDLTIVLGGPEVSYTGESWLDEFRNCRFIISGPGEAAFRYLAMNKFNLPRGVITVPNPAFRELPFPYVEKDFLSLKDRYLYYESSRGCPFSCTYCLSSRTDQKLEFRDMEQVKSELDFLAAHNPAVIKFVDRTFNISNKYSRAVWKHIIDSYSSGKTIFHFEIMPSLLSDDDFAILKEARPGLIQFEAGVQTVHTGTLERIRRKDDPDRSIDNLRRLVSLNNIHVHCDLLAGLPGEGLNDIRISFNSVYAIKPDHMQLGFLKVLHGTEMADNAGPLGICFNSLPPFEVTMTPDLSEDELQLLRGMADLLEKIFNENPFPGTLSFLEELYPSPFDLFRELAVFMHSKNYKLTHSWETCGEFLLKFITAGFPDILPFMRDCLRWDWCVRGRNHRYPGFLCGDITRRARLEGLKLPEVNRSFGNASSEDLIFFIAETDNFRNKKMNNRMTTYFILQKKS